MGAMNDDEPESQDRAPDSKVIDDETLVYDRGRATCLNEFAAKVWRLCDGTTSVADIADALDEDERAVWLALHRLNKSKRIVEEIALPPPRDCRTVGARGGRGGRGQHRHDDGGPRQLWGVSAPLAFLAPRAAPA